MKPHNEAIYCMALTMIPGIGIVSAKRLIEKAGSAFEAFTHFNQLLYEAKSKISPLLHPTEILQECEKIYHNSVENGIDVIPFYDIKYPTRLKECDDSPILLYCKGSTNLNKHKIVSIVGTRNMTSYGEQFCNDLISSLAVFNKDITIVSGLAYGVDITAHKRALKEELETIAVLAHGLDMIYPYNHRSIASKIIKQGVLLSEYPIGIFPDRHHFISRNRIIAGLSDATIIIESAAKGGALITADLANDYNRECFALPGRYQDTFSAGCNKLIKENKAQIIESAIDFIEAMNWGESNIPKQKESQLSLFTQELTKEEATIIQQIKDKGPISIDYLAQITQLEVYKLHPILFELEMKGLIRSSGGSSYQLNN